MATTASAALSSNGNLVGALSGACLPRDARKSHRTATRSRARRRAVGRAVPKQFPPELKIRAVALLLELKNAEHAAAQVMREFPGFSVTGQSVARWGKGLRVKLRKGRRHGAPGSRKQTSPHRPRVLELLAQGNSQADVARMLGISRQLVHALSRTNS